MPPSNKYSTKDREKFREVIKGTSRAISGNADLLITFGQDGPILSGEHMYLPDVSAKNQETQVRVIRGMADSLSLRSSCHNTSKHTKRAPRDAEARMIYDALEEVRYEMIGSERMHGMAENLWARLQDQLERRYTEVIMGSDDVPLYMALSLLAREALSGEPLKGKAAEVAEHWRGHIHAKSPEFFKGLEGKLHDQSAYAAEILNILKALNIDALVDKPGENEQMTEREVVSEQAEDLSDEQDGGSSDDEGSEGESDSSDEPEGDDRQDTEFNDQSMTDGEAENQANPAQQESGLPNFSVLEVPEAFGYTVFTKRYDEVIGAEDLAQPNELERLKMNQRKGSVCA